MMMKHSPCAYENQVEAAMLTGQSASELRMHVASCLVCQELVAVSEWLQGLANAPAPPPLLPDAAHLWYKAQFRQRQVAERRLIGSLVITRTIASLLFALGLGGWIFYHWPEMQNSIEHFSSSLLTSFSTNVIASMQPLVYLTIILFGINIGLTFRSFWIERKFKQ
jgi:hypothetical protein